MGEPVGVTEQLDDFGDGTVSVLVYFFVGEANRGLFVGAGGTIEGGRLAAR